MQIKLLGTGSILTKHLSSCAIINGNLLLDCPNGVMKSMRRMETNPLCIDICLITHFHADHCFDIPFLLLEQGLRNIRESDLIIIGPKGISDRVKRLFDMAYPEDWGKVFTQSKLRTIEIEKSEYPIEVGNYVIVPYRVEHVEYEAYGYVIENDGKRVGFTGDTVFCSNVEKIIKSSDLTFVDMSFEKNTKGHMGMNDIEILLNNPEYHNKIIPTHKTDGVRIIFEQKYFKPPIDGDEFYI